MLKTLLSKRFASSVVAPGFFFLLIKAFSFFKPFSYKVST